MCNENIYSLKLLKKGKYTIQSTNMQFLIVQFKYIKYKLFWQTFTTTTQSHMIKINLDYANMIKLQIFSNKGMMHTRANNVSMFINMSKFSQPYWVNELSRPIFGNKGLYLAKRCIQGPKTRSNMFLHLNILFPFVFFMNIIHSR